MATAGAENRPVRPIVGQPPKRAERQTLDVGIDAIAGQWAPNAALDAGTRTAENLPFCARKVTFFATKCLEVGLTRKSKYRNWRCRPVD